MTNREWLFKYYPDMIEKVIMDNIHIFGGEPVFKSKLSDISILCGEEVNNEWLDSEHIFDPAYPFCTVIQLNDDRIWFYVGADELGRHIAAENRKYAKMVKNNSMDLSKVNAIEGRDGSVCYFTPNEVTGIYKEIEKKEDDIEQAEKIKINNEFEVGDEVVFEGIAESDPPAIITKIDHSNDETVLQCIDINGEVYEKIYPDTVRKTGRNFNYILDALKSIGKKEDND